MTATEAPINRPLEIAFYHVWRTADLKKIVGSGRGGPYKRGRCICCDAEVWYQPAHQGDSVLVCWVCDP